MTLQYRIVLLKELIQVSIIAMAVKLHIRKLSVEEWQALRHRVIAARFAIAQLKERDACKTS